MRNKKIIVLLPYFYLVIIVLMVGGLYWGLHEKPQRSSITFKDSNEPEAEQLFVPIRIDSAVKILANPVLIPGSHLEVKCKKNVLTLHGESLYRLLDISSMRSSALWKDLGKYDSIISISNDFKTLTLGIYQNDEFGESYVNVPAGLLRGYIK